MEKKEILGVISALTNTYSSDNRRMLLEELRNLHTALQQIFAEMVLAWINDYAKNYNVDGRNRTNNSVCKRLVGLYRADTGEEKIKDNFLMI